jgi:hypothetical protein
MDGWMSLGATVKLICFSCEQKKCGVRLQFLLQGKTSCRLVVLLELEASTVVAEHSTTTALALPCSRAGSRDIFHRLSLLQLNSPLFFFSHRTLSAGEKTKVLLYVTTCPIIGMGLIG